MSSRALVETAAGVALVDVDEEDVLALAPGEVVDRARPVVALPLLLAADAHGSRVVAVVDRRPPLLVSDDAGTTWREAGAGLPAGRDVAISPEHPDRILFAAANRVYLSRDGGRFWHALAPELDDVRALAWDA